jgi:hypothetical protein
MGNAKETFNILPGQNKNSKAGFAGYLSKKPDGILPEKNTIGLLGDCCVKFYSSSVFLTPGIPGNELIAST